MVPCLVGSCCCFCLAYHRVEQRDLLDHLLHAHSLTGAGHPDERGIRALDGV